MQTLAALWNGCLEGRTTLASLLIQRGESLACAKERKAHDCSRGGSFAKDYGLRDQIRRAAVSVGSNIAEGYERGGNREFVQFLSQAKGSCGEVRAQLHFALDQKYLSVQMHQDLVDRSKEVSRMLAGLIRHLRNSDLKGPKYR